MKKFTFLGMFVMIIVFITSCGDVGGTVILENDSTSGCVVALKNSSILPYNNEQEWLDAGKSKTKHWLTKDVIVYVFVHPGGLGYWRVKSFSLSGGEIVRIKRSEITDFVQ